jgi:hypothetical protein
MSRTLRRSSCSVIWQTLTATCLLGVLVSLAVGETVVPPGTLGNETRTQAGSPYVVQEDITVPAGSTLTIEPGTVVEFGPDSSESEIDHARSELIVNGAVTATGSIFRGRQPNPGAVVRDGNQRRICFFRSSYDSRWSLRDHGERGKLGFPMLARIGTIHWIVHKAVADFALAHAAVHEFHVRLAYRLPHSSRSLAFMKELLSVKRDYCDVSTSFCNRFSRPSYFFPVHHHKRSIATVRPRD